MCFIILFYTITYRRCDLKRKCADCALFSGKSFEIQSYRFYFLWRSRAFWHWHCCWITLHGREPAICRPRTYVHLTINLYYAPYDGSFIAQEIFAILGKNSFKRKKYATVFKIIQIRTVLFSVVPSCVFWFYLWYSKVYFNLIHLQSIKFVQSWRNSSLVDFGMQRSQNTTFYWF